MRAFIIVTCAIVVGCHATILTPPTGPGTDYPCGLYGVECSNHMCCGEGFACGVDDPTCPAGMCCYVGPDEVRMRPQR